MRWESPRGVCRESSLRHWEESYNKVPEETLLLLAYHAVILRIKQRNYRSMNQKRRLLTTRRSFSVRNCGSYDLCIKYSIEQGIITFTAPIFTSAIILWNMQFTLQQWASTGLKAMQIICFLSVRTSRNVQNVPWFNTARTALV